MTRRRAVVLVVAVVAVLAMVGGVIGAIAGRGGKTGGGKTGGANGGANPPAVKSFNTDGLPPVHIDRCPTAAQLLPQPKTGKDSLPDLTLECIGAIGTADTVALRRLGGVPTVVNVWATWCVPCRQEMPDLQQVYAAAAGRVRIIGVNSQDYAEGARATINDTGVRYPSLADPGGKVRLAVGSQVMPITLFVSADGRLVYRKVGQYADTAAIKADIATYLGVRF